MHGLHLIADLAHCRSPQPALTDRDALAALLHAAVREAGLQEVGSSFHGFADAAHALHAGQPGGVTGVVLLAESHVAVHTWPEHSAVTLDVFVCNVHADNAPAARGLMAALVQAFGAQTVTQHEIRRADLRALPALPLSAAL